MKPKKELNSMAGAQHVNARGAFSYEKGQK